MLHVGYKKKQRINFYYTPPLPPKNILRPKTERERGNLFFNLILEGLVLCIIIHFSFEYALYSLTFLLSLSCCIFFFLSLIVNMFNGFFLFVVNAACLGLGRLWFYFWTFFLLFFFNALLIMMLFSFLSTSAAPPLPALPPVVAA